MQAKSTAFKLTGRIIVQPFAHMRMIKFLQRNICFHESVYSRLYESLSVFFSFLGVFETVRYGKLYLIRSTLAPSFVSFVRFRVTMVVLHSFFPN